MREVKRAALGIATNLRSVELRLGEPFFASMQQSADFFCKEFLSGQHRLEDPFNSLA